MKQSPPMYRALALALAFALFATTPLFADDEEKHPIDKQIEALEEKGGSTAEMVQTYEKGLKLWDAEMNKQYGELKKRLKPKAFTALQAAQRQWIAYRDLQISYVREFYGGFDGTMYIPMSVSAVMKITRSRALELKHSVEVLKEFGEQ